MAELTRHTIDTLVSDHQSGAALPQLTTFYPQSTNLSNAQFALDRVPELDLRRPPDEVEQMVSARSICDTLQSKEAQ
ncbi:MAG: hypothetical protein QOE94_1935 [Mycobacterium sp.]|nr:hypothetical protein [Mycobacterium sp.]